MTTFQCPLDTELEALMDDPCPQLVAGVRFTLVDLPRRSGKTTWLSSRVGKGDAVLFPSQRLLDYHSREFPWYQEAYLLAPSDAPLGRCAGRRVRALWIEEPWLIQGFRKGHGCYLDVIYQTAVLLRPEFIFGVGTHE